MTNKAPRVRTDLRRLLRQILPLFETETDVIERSHTTPAGIIDDEVIRREVRRRRGLIDHVKAALQ